MRTGILSSFTVLVVVLLLSPGGASAGTSPSPADVVRYELTIRPDFARGRVALRAAVDVEDPGLDSLLIFALNERYDSLSVAATDGGRGDEQALIERPGIERQSRWIAVHLRQPRTAFRLLFDLSGDLGRSGDERRPVLADSSLFLLWSDAFYPMRYDDWATVRTSVILPENFEVIAPGRRLERRLLASTPDSLAPGAAAGPHPPRLAETVFETSEPAVCYSILADSRWIREERTVDGLPMETLLHPGSRGFADQIFRTSAEVLGFYGKRLCPYPFDRFAFVTMDGMYARRAFPGFVAYSPAYLQREFTTTGHDAHESALLWWGCTLRGSGPGAFQWTEGFGDYAEILYDEASGKPVPAIFQQFRSEYLERAQEDVPPDSLRGSIDQAFVHGKYPWLMHLLRQATGDEAFGSALRLLFQRYRYRTFTLDQFVSTLEEGCGRSLEWWRHDWLDRPGVPTVRIDLVSAGPAEGRSATQRSFITRLRIRQEAPPRRFPLEIGATVRGEAEVERHRFWIASADTTVEIRTYDRPLLQADPGGRLPAHLESSLERRQTEEEPDNNPETGQRERRPGGS